MRGSGKGVRMFRLLGISFSATLLLVAVIGFVAFSGSENLLAAGNSADAFSVDMNIAGNTPTNLAGTSPHVETLGPTDFCARLNPNGIQDADETAVDTLTFDVTATNIPASTAMIGFAYTLHYDESLLTIQSQEQRFLIAANAGSSVLSAGAST